MNAPGTRALGTYYEPFGSMELVTEHSLVLRATGPTGSNYSQTQMSASDALQSPPWSGQASLCPVTAQRGAVSSKFGVVVVGDSGGGVRTLCRQSPGHTLESLGPGQNHKTQTVLGHEAGRG